MALICQCGCGEEIPPKPSHRRYQPKYIQTHFLKISQARRTEASRRTKEAKRIKPPIDWVVPSGFCECGCGAKTTVNEYTSSLIGHYKGYPQRYIRGHSQKGCGKGPDSGSWNGGRFYHKSGYVMVYARDCPGSNNLGYIPEHRQVYEASRGFPLPPDMHVHHINGVRDDNRPENLVALSRTNHKRVHQLQAGILSILLDDRLNDAARQHVKQFGTIPDVAELTQSVYGGQATASA